MESIQSGLLTRMRQCPQPRKTGMEITTWLKSAWAFPGGTVARNMPVRAGDAGLIPGLGRSPGLGNATHSRVLAWKTPWTEELSGLQSGGVTKELDWTEHIQSV